MPVLQANNPFTVSLILKDDHGIEVARSNEHKIFVGRPVILVHGSLSDAKEMEGTKVREKLSNYYYVRSVEYVPADLLKDRDELIVWGTLKGDIKDYAKNLKTEINSLMQETGARKADIVGHSMGGLVSRGYIEKLGNSDNIGKLILLGTPNHGTDITKSYYDLDSKSFNENSACKQMISESKFLNELNTKTSRGAVDYYILASDSYVTLNYNSSYCWTWGDLVVTYDSAVIDGKIIKIDVNHGNQINRLDVFNHVKAILN